MRALVQLVEQVLVAQFGSIYYKLERALEVVFLLGRLNQLKQELVGFSVDIQKLLAGSLQRHWLFDDQLSLLLHLVEHLLGGRLGTIIDLRLGLAGRRG